ncbi:hypothetical protein MRB53_016338 [Persea americana]|uniref:Uncharacterized protein n=1 Tax=Persea americana TaxID=3435 RepID=A0ACC2M2V0_PERAE|nr:hypothetical protein MRB53_016338 [Persea americana]
MAQESQPYFSIGATTEQLKACCIEHLLVKWDAGSPMAYIPAVHNIPVQSKNRHSKDAVWCNKAREQLGGKKAFGGQANMSVEQQAPTVPQRRNHVFNAEMDELLPELMLEQVALGRKGGRGFKDEAYVAVVSVMTAANKSGKVLTESTIRNRCKTLNQHSVCTELLNAYEFDFNNATKRIMASNVVWSDWLMV